MDGPIWFHPGKLLLLSWSQVQIPKEEAHWFCFNPVILSGPINELLLCKWVHSKNHIYGAWRWGHVLEGDTLPRGRAIPTEVTISNLPQNNAVV